MNLDTSSESRKVVKDTEISKILRKKSEIFKIFKISKNPKTSFLMFLSDLEQKNIFGFFVIFLEKIFLGKTKFCYHQTTSAPPCRARLDLVK